MSQKNPVSQNVPNISEPLNSKEQDSGTADASTQNYNIHSGHRARMIKKYQTYGISVFEEHEMLEIILFNFYPRRNTNDIAHELINRFGSVQKVFEASLDELKSVNNVGEKAAVQISFMGDFFRYIQSRSPDIVHLRTVSEIQSYCASIYSNESKEHGYILLIDSRDCLISRIEIGTGTSSGVEIKLSDIVKSAVKSNAKKAIAVHNHPSSVASASVEDIYTTRALAEGLKNVGIKLIDHIIVSPDNIYSMRDKSNTAEIFN